MTDATPVALRSDRPHSARMYDYFLGGKDNYQVDREAAEQVLQWWPGARKAAQVNRAFMHRATRALTQEGISQFLDIGTGIPTQPNLHEVAQRVNPAARVVYVDNDPIVLSHARALLVSAPQGYTTYIHADATSPESILNSEQLTSGLDLSKPVAVSLVALMHFITDESVARRIVSMLTDALVPGSYLVMSHVSADFDPPAIGQLSRIYNEQGVPLRPRSSEEFEQLFLGFDLLEPGIVPAHRWRPEDEEPPTEWDAEASLYAGVARK
ncbi:SAM-dependent methyltransferase [Nocardia takedensis]